MATPYLYDRVQIYIDGIPYLENGKVLNFSMQVAYNERVMTGMTPTGNAFGKVVGNKTIPSITWNEYLPSLDELINWRTFCLANPNAIYTIVPITLVTGVSIAPSFTITGLGPTSIVISSSGEGDAITRSCAFNAIDASNT